MTTTSRHGRRRAALVSALLVLLALLSLPGGSAQAVPSEGLQCETSPSNSFTLTATSGYILTPDGNSIFMWGYAGASGAFQLPGPTLCVNQGATVTVTLRNLLREPVSIAFPGQTGVQADGQPAQPVLSGGRITSLVKPAAANGGGCIEIDVHGARVRLHGEVHPASLRCVLLALRERA